MEEITSLVITRKATKYWVYVVNGETESRDANAYTGTRQGDYITIKTLTGAPQAVRVYFNVIQYIDNLDPTNNLTDPSNAEEVQGHLISQGFYTDDTTGGGTGGVDIFKLLLDVNVPSFSGRAKQVLAIDDNEAFVITKVLETISRIQDATDYIGGQFLPNKYLMTSNQVDEDGFSVGLVQADNDLVVNTPIPFGVYRVKVKGYIESGTVEPYTYTPNIENFVLESGDIVEGISATDGKLYEMRYISGNPTLLSNYEIIGWKKISIPGEPTYTS